MFYLIPQTIGLLVICSGLGIIFGAFGSTAVINYKGVVVAGVAAIAIALLLIVNQMMADSMLRLKIDGDVRGAQIDLIGDDSYPGAHRNGRYFEFYILASEIRSDRLTLIATLPSSSGDADQQAEAEILFECIPSDAVERYLGSGRILQWRLDATTQRLILHSDQVVESGPCRERDENAPAIAFGRLPSLITSASAQQAMETLLNDLVSESAAVRRSARKSLSAQGQAAVQPMLQHWANNSENYRVKLGVVVALAEFLRDNKDKRKDVSSLLTDRDMEMLASAAGDPDRTVRIYASEFLYDLGDMRILPIARRLFPQASDDGKYNLLIALQGAIPELPEGERTALVSTLQTWREAVGPNTRSLIDKMLQSLSA